MHDDDYRADLGLDQSIFRPMQHPGNVWSLHGYVTCLEQLGRHAEADALRMQRDLALARTDVAISASCFCAMAHLDHDDHAHDACCH